MKKVLTIAGSDCSGGAGIQADLKTFCAHGVYGMSVITSLTAQNTQGVIDVMNVSTNMVQKQMDAVLSDIFPDAIKIGMVSSADIIKTIAAQLKKYACDNIVLDTVMISTSGHRLLDKDAIAALVDTLLPLASITTPNLHEAQALCGFDIATKEEMLKAAKAIQASYGGYILIKGGHLTQCSDDLLYKDGQYEWYEAKRLDNPNTHGTGCTLSSAIASNLAKGKDIFTAVGNAKQYVYQAIAAGLDLGKGDGPIHHGYGNTPVF